MNLIIGNLSSLKTAVLPPVLREAIEYDQILQSLGRGVAAALQSFCNRKFERLVDDTFERSGNTAYISLPRFPVETVSMVELKYGEAAGWIEQPLNNILSINNASGIIEFGYVIGCWTDRVRITYTGGYYANYIEDADPNPLAGATTVPDDIVRAWHLQCQHEIEINNLLGAGSAQALVEGQIKYVRAQQPELKLLERVREMLTPFVRYA
jgi:hypothetical protein